MPALGVLAAAHDDAYSILTAQPETEPAAGGAVDKSELAIGAPRRVRDNEHLAYVATLACLICGRAPSQAHHLRFAQPRALGSKVSDEWVVPLCNLHHRALHDTGDEEMWWKAHGVDAQHEAERLWKERKGVVSSSAPVLKISGNPTAGQLEASVIAAEEKS